MGSYLRVRTLWKGQNVKSVSKPAAVHKRAKVYILSHVNSSQKTFFRWTFFSISYIIFKDYSCAIVSKFLGLKNIDDICSILVAQLQNHFP